jgi:tRNA threonylcarbamoyladenosine biosynthesis protein TsaB
MKLGIETSSRNCSVVLWDNQGSLFLKERSESEFVHAECLHGMIEDVLVDAGKSWDQLEKVVVGRGPGSYTGLRIGIAGAKGLCYSLGIPLYSVSSLSLMMWNDLHFRKLNSVLCVMDARRMEVFGSEFSFGRMLSPPAPIVFEQQEVISQWLRIEGVLGENATKLSGVLGDHVQFHDALPSASAMAMEGIEELFQLENLAYFEPEYVKPFIPTLSKR